jgi:hypothetical protein
MSRKHLRYLIFSCIFLHEMNYEALNRAFQVYLFLGTGLGGILRISQDLRLRREIMCILTHMTIVCFYNEVDNNIKHSDPLPNAWRLYMSKIISQLMICHMRYVISQDTHIQCVSVLCCMYLN